VSSDALEPLEALLARAPRGPARDGLYAAWLAARVTLDLALEPPLPERALRRRIDALETRIAKLRMAAPLRRALAGILPLLRDTGHRTAPVVLAQLVAPVREAIGAEAGDAVLRAVRAARR
jgi:hypothetical protein